MFSLLASHPVGPLDGVNLYFYELEAIFVAIASLCMIVFAIRYFLKSKPTHDDESWS